MTPPTQPNMTIKPTWKFLVGRRHSMKGRGSDIPGPVRWEFHRKKCEDEGHHVSRLFSPIQRCNQPMPHGSCRGCITTAVKRARRLGFSCDLFLGQSKDVRRGGRGDQDRMEWEDVPGRRDVATSFLACLLSLTSSTSLCSLAGCFLPLLSRFRCRNTNFLRYNFPDLGMGLDLFFILSLWHICIACPLSHRLF